MYEYYCELGQVCTRCSFKSEYCLYYGHGHLKICPKCGGELNHEKIFRYKREKRTLWQDFYRSFTFDSYDGWKFDGFGPAPL